MTSSYTHISGFARRRGFTLIELLVVIAIISLLLAILLPSLNSARDRTKLVACRNNLRSIWTGVLAYALENKDRVPYMTNINQYADPNFPGVDPNDPNTDPFDPRFRTSIGYVLFDYVNPKNFVCPSAVRGYPKNVGSGDWKISYTFRTADFGGTSVGPPTPYDAAIGAYSGRSGDPAILNYRQFDGRPLELLDGRRYVHTGGINENLRGKWNLRFPLISEPVVVDGNGNVQDYPHRGVLDKRNDLQNYEQTYEDLVGYDGATNGYLELHADGERVDILYTRGMPATFIDSYTEIR